MKSGGCRLLVIWMLVLMGSGCASLPNSRSLQIDERKLSYASQGDGSPVVVFISGMGPTMSTWSPVFDDLSGLTRVFAYDRPVYGSSSMSPVPGSAREIATQLHQNLSSTGHLPPYLLVGHSAGGLYANVFARLFPGEVMGIVLLDSTHPHQLQYFKEEKPMLYLMFTATTITGNIRYEAAILKNVHTEFDAIDPFPDIPLLVLTAEKSSFFETAEMREKWLEFQKDLASMSPKGRQKVVDGAGHFIHQDNPQFVIQKITEMIHQGGD